MEKFYLTTPIYYVNANPHIGHAYTNIICDCLARFQRMKGNNVFFLTGSDEHGEKIHKASLEAGTAVKDFVDKKVDTFKKLWQNLNLSHDFFVRTSWQNHKDAVRKFIEELYKKGDIYKSKYKAFYCVGCETFWTKSQLVDSNKCPECRRISEQILEENYFFKLSRYQDWFIDYLNKNPGFVRPEIRYNEVKGFLKSQPLTDLCISRPKKRVSWGIEFPLDSNYVVYVWFDALINYLSGIGYASEPKKFETFWPADIHFIGKDILRHHAIFWPIMLKAMGLDLPGCIFAHGWWKVKEEKMSKSKGNIVNPFKLIDELSILLDSNQDIAADAFRYFLMREIPIGLDGNFSLQALINRTNADLANDLGNLVYRSLNMAEKYTQGKVESASKDIPDVFQDKINNLEKHYSELVSRGDFFRALEYVFEFIRMINKYIEDTKPWNLQKEAKKDSLISFLYSICESIRIVSIYLYPIMPRCSFLIQRQLGIEDSVFSFQNARWGIPDSFLIKKEKPLFPRIDVS